VPGQKILGADAAVAEQVERGAGGAMKVPVGNLHAVVVVHRVVAIESHRRQVRENFPAAGVAVQLAENQPPHPDFVTAGEELVHLVRVVLVHHAGDLDWNPRRPQNGRQVGHAPRAGHFLESVRVEGRKGDRGPVVKVEGVHPGQGQLPVGVKGELRCRYFFPQPADQPRLVAVELGIGSRAGKDDLPHAVPLQQGHENVQLSQGELVQVVPVERRVYLLADAVRAALVARSGKQNVGKIVFLSHLMLPF